MRIVHYTINNGSGLRRASINMMRGERALGLDSSVCYTDTNEAGPIREAPEFSSITTEESKGADIRVIHSHIPAGVQEEGRNIFVAHGTPEHCFAMSVDQGKAQGIGASDPFMMTLYRLQRDAVTVTFWDRHAAILRTWSPKSVVECIPLGIDRDFWDPVPSFGKWAGSPSILTCENGHPIKWPLDMVLMFPLLRKRIPGTVLHAYYLPADQHRYWYPLMHANGTSFHSFSGGVYFDDMNLRNAFCSVDYFLSPVRYGDFNNLCLEAKACGARVISFRGNPYADFWITEGDQREQAKELVRIIEGKTKPRNAIPVPDMTETAARMAKIYERLMSL